MARVRPAKVARPALKLRVVVPPPRATPGTGPARATVTLPPPVYDGTRLPYWSPAWTARPNALPAATEAGGWAVTTSSAAGPASTLKGLVVTADSPVPDTCSVYPIPALSRLTSVKLAVPTTTGTVRVPPRLPSTATLVGAMARLPLKLVTALPKVSSTATVTGDGKIWPAVTVADGWTITASCAAVPAETFTVSELDGGARPLLETWSV